jgi:hypothetical protein
MTLHPMAMQATRGGQSTGGSKTAARKVLGWPKRCKLVHAFMWEYGYKRLKFAQLLGQLGVFLTCDPASAEPGLCVGGPKSPRRS